MTKAKNVLGWGFIVGVFLLLGWIIGASAVGIVQTWGTWQ